MEAELKKRVITGSALGAAGILLILLSHSFPFFRYGNGFIVFALVVLCAWEYSTFSSLQISRDHSSRPIQLIAILTGPFITLLLLYFSITCPNGSLQSVQYDRLLLISLFLSAIIWLFIFVRMGGRDLHTASTIMQELLPAIWLIAFGGIALLFIILSASPPLCILWFLLVVCVNDIAAYFVGKKYGQRKLAPALSPKKTLEGSAGGILGGILTGLICSFLLPGEFTVFSVLVFSLVIVLFAQAGDLLKSYLKRLAGTKDSGNLLPGHGGMLDRLDGILMAAPVFFLAL